MSSPASTSHGYIKECQNNPTIDCSLYNINTTCDENGIYYPWAQEHCPLFCGFCQAPTVTIDCVDQLHNCDEYQRDLCTNSLYRLFREQNCRKYCRICKDFDFVPANSVFG
ncbi:uncharacterized protein ZK673.1-like [Crassostrea angulata]|uniref:ShKT domain-containing protein n=1 Tax=Magallana gigas TaxID=29159 RepID=A0A8W8IX93_MAGGI|nr:uncharacterized protein ZK673.1 [Crassostrea gigas]XP_052703991.1 uncharacterized protein ZK673.1-like [Crassostrea angulata]|eukprot:XP_011421151.1 PREDICTED: uncharacterized protein ZK673.1-like [Crassostrea gigas]